MRNLILSALILASAFQSALGEQSGDWTYTVSNNQATIRGYTGAGGTVSIPSSVNGIPVVEVWAGSSRGIFDNKNTSVTSLTIPSSLTSIGYYAFQGCSSLTSLTIPNSVTSIGEGGFAGCSGLINLAIPNGVTSIGKYAFAGCSGLTSLTIPNSVTSIEEGALYYCSSLISLTIPNSVTSIGEGALYYCSGLTSLTIPNSVTSIGRSAFQSCTGLTSVTLPNNATTIVFSMFLRCTSLTSVTIPNSVTSIGYSAFQECSALTNLTIPNSVTSIEDNAFFRCDLITVRLPARFQQTYQNLGLTASQVIFGFTLATFCNATEGTLLINPSKSAYEVGDIVEIIATPKVGYLFGNWSAASAATTRSITLTMDADKVATANFIQDGGDTDGDGLTNYQESVTYGTNPNQKDTNSDGVEDGQAVSMGYNPTLNFSALIAHPPTGLYTASQMQAMAIGDLVLTKNANGSFTLNYDIEQSTDLQNWTPYQAYALPLTGLPTDKAFVRIKAKQ